MSTCKEKTSLSSIIVMIKKRLQIKPLDEVMKELNAVEYDMYHVGWECDSKFWLLENGLMITTDHCQVVEFTQDDYKTYKQNLQKYISNLPNHIKSKQKHEEINDPWEKLEELKKSTTISTKELTIKELINKLEKLPQNAKVLVDGYESGLDSIIDAYQIKAKFQEKSNWWDGVYKKSSDNIDAIYLKSTRRLGE